MRTIFIEDGRMRSRIVASLLVLLCAVSSFARTAKPASHPLDPDYAAALAAANHFLYAWQTEDHETGIVMLSDTARQHASPDFLQSFFSPGPQAAFEIARGKRLTRGQYEFPVVLFGSASGNRPRECKIVVVRAKKDDWAIERLPLSH